jgi:hypothetical protein
MTESWSSLRSLSTTVGERIGVANGSVRRMSWIATSSSEMTLADVGVGVGRGCAPVASGLLFKGRRTFDG